MKIRIDFCSLQDFLLDPSQTKNMSTPREQLRISLLLLLICLTPQTSGQNSVKYSLRHCRQLPPSSTIVRTVATGSLSLCSLAAEESDGAQAFRIASEGGARVCHAYDPTAIYPLTDRELEVHSKLNNASKTFSSPA